MHRRLIAGIFACALLASCASPDRPPPGVQSSDAADGSPLLRRYVEGETSHYLMTSSHASNGQTITYTAEAESVVTVDADGRFVEEVRWTRVNMMGQEMPLDEFSKSFRQRLSLDGRVEPAPPATEDIARINPMLIGPVFDLMTFYVDHYLAVHGGSLRKSGDEFFQAHGEPNSWADGTNTIIGEDCIDFEVELREVCDSHALISVRHVPPKETSVRLIADWMRDDVVSGVPNNWVQVQRNRDADLEFPYTAAAGHEVFDVLITIERPSGRIIKATMHNPVDLVQRQCKDESLTDCGEPVRFRILREIELKRVR